MMKRVFIFLSLGFMSLLASSQAHVMIEAGVRAVATGDVQLVSDGDVRTDGTITSSGTSVWNFKGSSLQRITCLALGGCAQNHALSCNSSSYTTGFMNLFQDNPSGIRIETNTKVDGIHTFNQGICQVQEGSIWLTTAGAFASNNNNKFYATIGHGLVQQPAASATFYPIGTTASSTNFAPAELTNSGTADQFGIRIYDSVYAWYTGVPGGYNSTYGDPVGTQLNNHRVAKTWIINECALGGGDVDVKLYWQTPHEYFDFDRMNCQVMYWDYNTNFWDQSYGFSAAIASAIAGTNFYQARSYNSTYNYPYRPMWVEDMARFLSVQELELNVRRDNKDAMVEWKTINERNIDHYDVMFSTDSRTFSKIGERPSSGNGDFNYNFRQLNIDQYAARGTRRLFYQIKPVDRNGNISYSQIRSLIISADNNWGLQFYPNPASHYVFIKGSGLSNGPAEMRLVNNIGQVVMQKVSVVQNGILNETIDVSRLSAGIYNLTLLNGGSQHNQKIVVAR